MFTCECVIVNVLLFQRHAEVFVSVKAAVVCKDLLSPGEERCTDV